MDARTLQVLQQQSTVDVFGVYYLPEAGERLAEPEGVALLLDGGSSLVFTSATDWTLTCEIAPPNALPRWCFPPEDWTYGRLAHTQLPMTPQQYTDIEELKNEMSETIGAKIRFQHLVVDIRAGEPLYVRVTQVSD